MGYKFNEVRKRVYKDGHERADVVNYRQEYFLPTLQALEPRMVKWTLDENENVTMIMHVNLPPHVRPIVLVTHDESTFDSNDGRVQVWYKEGGAPLRKKSRGKGIMIFDFIFPGRRLRAPNSISPEALPTFGLDEQAEITGKCHEDPYSSTMKLEYGQNKWWESEDLINQVISIAIPIFELAFPGCEALFLFDNATSHAAFARNALRAKVMDLHSGGKQPKMWDGVNPVTQMPQSMCNADGQPKGLKLILEESGEWRPGLQVQCKEGATANV